jgi:hypothetical protein
MKTLYDIRNIYNTTYIYDALEILDFKDELMDISRAEEEERLKREKQELQAQKQKAGR